MKVTFSRRRAENIGHCSAAAEQALPSRPMPPPPPLPNRCHRRRRRCDEPALEGLDISITAALHLLLLKLRH
jgi:hypothetical protein